MKIQVNRPLRLLVSGVLLPLSIVVGCKTNSPSHYISPKVTGRVLDAQTREPIKGVKVQRVIPNPVVNMDGTPKAGQVMEGERGTSTDADGSFVLGSKRDIELFADVGWGSVTISFSHSDYVTLVRTYPASKAVTSPDGEPVVNVGTIALTGESK
jgi:hypothetical protein